MASIAASISVEDNISNLCVIISIAKNNSDLATSVIYARRLNDDFDGDGHPFRLSKLNYMYFWENFDITREELELGSIAEYIEAGDEFLYVRNTKKRRQDVDKIQMDLAFGESAFKGIEDGFPDAIIAKTKGIYQECQPVPNPRICLISMQYATIQNGRLCFVTRLDEYVDLRLNCRENLVLCTSPVQLQMRHLADDDDVGDVAVVKLEKPDISLRKPTYQAVCEGLILKHKPKIISVDEEPVEIADHSGKLIQVPGNVKFDTGNNAGTAISEVLVNKLGLHLNDRKKVKVSLAGDNFMQCCRVKVTLVIRKHRFIVHALVGATASDTDLLVGMDVIQQLNDKGYFLGC